MACLTSAVACGDGGLLLHQLLVEFGHGDLGERRAGVDGVADIFVPGGDEAGDLGVDGSLSQRLDPAGLFDDAVERHLFRRPDHWRDNWSTAGQSD